MIQLINIDKGYGPKQLLKELTWRVDGVNRLALIGPNGAGKSTLLKILAGVLEPDAGRVVRPRGSSVGYLPQEVEHLEEGSALSIVMGGRRDLLEQEAEIRQLEAAAGSLHGEALESSTRRLGELQTAYEIGGGYELEANARSILAALGFAPEEIEQPPVVLSGGWRMRVFLARLLLQGPDLLLLDEPTNHLDLPALRWLESFLAGYPGTVLMVSHDRTFLNRCVEAIATLEYGQVKVYPGNFDQYLQRRAEEAELLEAQAAQQEKKIAQTQAFIDRFRAKATKAKAVQSRVRQLEKMSTVQLQQQDKTIAFKLPKAKRSGKLVAELTAVGKRYGEKIVYEALDLTIHRGQRIALVGPNGAGKSTLLKILAGSIDFTGKLRLGEGVERAYFAQHQVDALDFTKTPLEEMTAQAEGHSLTQLRGFLGAFLFDDEMVQKPIGVLSGGEKNRLAMARILLGTPNLLLMDEPTNHLDLASREALEEALAQYGGTLVFISHDRAFINRLANRVLHVEHGRAADYPGNYDDYERALERESALQKAEDEDPSAPSSGNARKAQRRAQAEARARHRAATKAVADRIKALEKRVHELESRLAEVDSRLADPATYEDPALAVRYSKEQIELKRELDPLMEAWTEAQIELEEIEAELE